MPGPEQQENPFVAMMNRSELTCEMMTIRANTKLPEPVKEDQSSKVIVVTGATAGIGYETAKFIAALNPKKLILACRNLSKANEAINKIKAATGCDTMEAWELDLSSFASVKAFAEKFNRSGLPLDTLVSNAGVASAEWCETNDGYEATYQVNHISNMLLVLLLTPALKKSTSPRVQIVASEVHYWALGVNQDDPTPVTTFLNKVNNLPYGQTYFRSKLLNVLFVQEYARRSDIWICSTTPGYTESELGSKHPTSGEANQEGRLRHNLFPQRTTYDGAKTIIHCAVHPTPGKSGGFYSEMSGKSLRLTWPLRIIAMAQRAVALAFLLKSKPKVIINTIAKYIVENEEVPGYLLNALGGLPVSSTEAISIEHSLRNPEYIEKCLRCKQRFKPKLNFGKVCFKEHDDDEATDLLDIGNQGAYVHQMKCCDRVSISDDYHDAGGYSVDSLDFKCAKEYCYAGRHTTDPADIDDYEDDGDDGDDGEEED